MPCLRCVSTSLSGWQIRSAAMLRGITSKYPCLAPPCIHRATILTAPQGRIPDVTLRCIRYVRAKYSAGVSVEAEKPCREGLEKLAAEADVVFYSKTWAEVGDPDTKLRRVSEGN